MFRRERSRIGVCRAKGRLISVGYGSTRRGGPLPPPSCQRHGLPRMYRRAVLLSRQQVDPPIPLKVTVLRRRSASGPVRRMTPWPAAQFSLISTQLGAMNRYLCAAPSYLAKRGTPATLDELTQHDAIEMPAANGRAFPWIFRKGDETVRVEPQPRVCVDAALTIFRLIRNGAGVGVLSAYLCGPEVIAGRLVRLLPDWSCRAAPVSLVYPSRRELAPTVRAFAEFMKEATATNNSWRGDPLTEA